MRRSQALPWISLGFFAFFGVLGGCSDDPSRLTNGSGPDGYYATAEPDGVDTGGDPDSKTSGGRSAATSAAPPTVAPSGPAPNTSRSFGEEAVRRARSWVEVAMPYCGGPNGGKDVLCGGTCSRTGAAAKPEWDAYRSDCSGFVSYAWGMKAPGRTTRTLAPHDDAESSVITVDELAPGDALNNDSHVMLFGGWADKAAGTAILLQAHRCGKVASEKTIKLTKIESTKVRIEDTTGRVFIAIRKKGIR